MTTLPSEFVAYFTRLIAQCESIACARRALLLDWARGHAVPGYGVRADWFAKQSPAARESAIAHALIAGSKQVLPPGWSYSNLSRVIPCKSELALMRPRVVRVGVSLRPWDKPAIESFFRAVNFRAVATAGL